MNESVLSSREALAEFIQTTEFSQVAILYDEETGTYYVNYK